MQRIKKKLQQIIDLLQLMVGYTSAFLIANERYLKQLINNYLTDVLLFLRVFVFDAVAFSTRIYRSDSTFI